MRQVKNMNKFIHMCIIQSLLFTITAILFFGVGESYAANNPALPTAKPMPTKPIKLAEQRQLDKSKISNDAIKVFVKQVQIYGSIAKPQAIFFYKSGDPKVDGLKINRHFFDHIFRNVEKNSVKRLRKKETTKRNHIEW